MFSYPGIVELAKKSGLPYRVSSTYRPGAITLSGNVSHHAKGDAVDFGGYSQDALAAYFLGLPNLEVFHKSIATGRWYGSSKGKPTDEATHQDLVNQHKDHLHVAMSNEQVGSGATSNPFLAPGAAIMGAVTSPFDAAANITDVLRPIGIVSMNLANPQFWRRIGMGVVGGSLIFTGILFLLRRRIETQVGRVAGLVGGTAQTAIQGAAFGFGAGKTGGLGGGGGAPKSAPPSAPPGPYPPRRALPPSNAPVTAVLPEAYAPVSAGGTYEVTTYKGRAKRPSAPLPDTVRAQPKKSRKGGTENLFTPSFTMRDTKK